MPFRLATMVSVSEIGQARFREQFRSPGAFRARLACRTEEARDCRSAVDRRVFIASALGGLYAYTLRLERPQSRSLPPFGQSVLSAQLRRPRPWSATSAIRRQRPCAARRYRSLPGGLANGSTRPEGGLQDEPCKRAGRERKRTSAEGVGRRSAAKADMFAGVG